MTISETFERIYSDYRRYRAIGGESEGSLFGVILFSQGFWASSIYRLAHYVEYLKFPFLRRFLRFLFIFIQKAIEVLTNIRIPPACTIGRGLYIGHFGPTIINSSAQIGDYCNLSQGVTIGIVHRGKREGVPRIGNRVYIGPNAIVIGGIVIGDDVAIGAGAVVTQSVPDRAVVAGNPAKTISYKGSFDFVRYDGMAQDAERQASFLLRESSVKNDEVNSDLL